MTTFRIGEAAALLSVSSDTVRRLVEAGRLVAVAVIKSTGVVVEIADPARAASQ